VYPRQLDASLPKKTISLAKLRRTIAAPPSSVTRSGFDDLVRARMPLAVECE
jgi:hypothetical protein